MNNDIGTASAQGEGTALPPPRLLGEMTTLTFASGRAGSGAVGTMMARPASDCGASSSLRAAILHVEPDALTITF